MDWMEILQPAVQMIVTAIVGLLASIAITAIETKKKEILQRMKDERARKYVEMVTDTIKKCVLATNQTYVESLKDQNIFDEAAQKEAFRRTYEAVLDILTGDAINFISEVYGDVEGYITNSIEAQVNLWKEDKQ